MVIKTEVDAEVKDWFGQGEIDVDRMLKSGVLTEVQLLGLFNNRQNSTEPESNHCLVCPLFSPYAEPDRQKDNCTKWLSNDSACPNYDIIKTVNKD